MNLATTNIIEDSAILINDKISQALDNECDRIACDELKFNDDLDLVDEEEIEADDGTSVDLADDDNDEDEDEDEERDLTNLAWLTELRNQSMGLVNMPLDEELKKENNLSITVAKEQMAIQQMSHFLHVTEKEVLLKSNAHMLDHKNQRIGLQIPQHKSDESRAAKILNQPKRPSPAERYEMFLNKIKRDFEIYKESAISYQSDVAEKPPFNYSHIIGMAMLENGRRVTLQQICSWIERKFAFFRVRKKWNNSIRHNLSLHPCFRKIGRNKEDKGKGGYWELGVDPKKCDRKRIRNRKSTAQSAKIQKKHLQAHFVVKTSKRRQQNLCSGNKKHSSKLCNSGYLRNLTCELEYEELILDEMDVQQNVDVMSTNKNIHKNSDDNNTTSSPNICYKQQMIYETLKQHNSQNAQREAADALAADEEEGEAEDAAGEVMLTNLINDNDDQIHLQQNIDFKEFNTSCPLANDDICVPEHEHISEQICHHQQQQYKLGTIIISSANTGADMRSIQNLNQRTINSFLTNNSTKQVLAEEQLCTKSIRYAEVENVPQNNTTIISSYISNLSDGFSTCSTHASKSNQCHNCTSSNSSNSITLDFSAFPTQTIQQKPNVIVEQLIQQPSMNYSAIEISSDRITTSSPSSSSLNSSSTATMCTIGSQNEDYTNELVNEHFRPYIDGIDEAFQYLRSIDSTRNEDILDNLLDISVSDY